MIRPGATL